MVQLALLAVSWTLLRRYVTRRRTRLERESIMRRMTQKLRALAQRGPSRSRGTAAEKSTFRALSA